MSKSNGYATRADVKRKHKDVETPLGRCRIRLPSARDFVSLRPHAGASDEEQSARLVAMCYVDGEGKPQYSPNEWETLLDEMDGGVYLALLEECRGALAGKDPNELAKNLEGATSIDSSADSHATSAT